ncbi:MAG: hypothetical protein WBF08_09600 [Candidatus Bathyarchaeia archaeon]
MNHAYRLLIPAFLLITMLIGSVSAPTCPDIPDPPYVPEFPEEDIIKVEAYIDSVTTITTTATTTTVAQSLRPIVNGPILHLTVTFAKGTPPPDKGILILVTMLQGNPPTEVVLGCLTLLDPPLTTYTLDIPVTTDGGVPSIAVYAALVEFSTDRAPNDGFYQITSLSASDPNVFQDYDPAPVGGVVTPVNKLEILAPYIALAGLIAVISAIVIKKRK